MSHHSDNDPDRLGIITRKIEELTRKVDEIRTSLFGAEGHGGLHSWVSDLHTRVTRLEGDYNVSKGKLIGICIGVSGFISLVTFLIQILLKRG